MESILPESRPASNAASDVELLRRVVDGDDVALGALYDRHAGLVFKLAIAIVGTEADAEEVTTDVFVHLWEKGREYDPARASVRGWLAVMTRTRSLDRLRSTGRRRAAHERAAAASAEGAAVEISTPEPADRRSYLSQLRGALDKALSALNPDQRRAIELAYFSGLTQSEIADRLGEPIGTVKTRIRDGMARLRRRTVGEGGS